MAQPGDQPVQRHRVGAHAHPAMRDVRAADVDFQHVRRTVGKLGDHFGIIVIAMASHIGDDGCAFLLELGQFVDEIMVDTGVL